MTTFVATTMASSSSGRLPPPADLHPDIVVKYLERLGVTPETTRAIRDQVRLLLYSCWCLPVLDWKGSSAVVCSCILLRWRSSLRFVYSCCISMRCLLLAVFAIAQSPLVPPTFSCCKRVGVPPPYQQDLQHPNVDSRKRLENLQASSLTSFITSKWKSAHASTCFGFVEPELDALLAPVGIEMELNDLRLRPAQGQRFGAPERAVAVAGQGHVCKPSNKFYVAALSDKTCGGLGVCETQREGTHCAWLRIPSSQVLFLGPVHPPLGPLRYKVGYKVEPTSNRHPVWRTCTPRSGEAPRHSLCMAILILSPDASMEVAIVTRLGFPHAACLLLLDLGNDV